MAPYSTCSYTIEVEGWGGSEVDGRTRYVYIVGVKRAVKSWLNTDGLEINSRHMSVMNVGVRGRKKTARKGKSLRFPMELLLHHRKRNGLY